MWLFLLATRHRMQALSALARSVGCAFLGFASLKIALFIQPHNKVGKPIYFWVTHFLISIDEVLCRVFIFCHKAIKKVLKNVLILKCLLTLAQYIDEQREV